MGEKNPQSFHERIITGIWEAQSREPQPSLEGERGLLEEMKSLRRSKDEWELRGRV